MKKVFASVLVMSVVLAPLSFAGSVVCASVNSSNYWKATGSRLLRGLGNAAFSWVELFRQPAIRENKWEGAGRGVVHTVGRAAAGVLEVATSFIPAIQIPQLAPACPTDLLTETK